MRNLLITVAAAASALAVATPAAAQYHPQPRGHAYGYNNYGHVRALHARINQIQREIDRLDRRNILSNREARGLRVDARDLERRLYQRSRNGLTPNEFAQIRYRLDRLEHRLVRDANDGNRRWRDRRY